MRAITWIAAWIATLVAGCGTVPLGVAATCSTCAVRARTKVITKTVIKRVIDPVAVFVPSYIATIAAPYAVAVPAPVVPPPPPPVYPQPQALPAPLAAAAPIAQPCAPACIPSADLAAALDRINQRLCVLEAQAPAPSGVPVAPGPRPILPPARPPLMPRAEEPLAAPPQPQAVAPGLPRAFATKCAACHTQERAAQFGGGFTMFSGGKLVLLSERQLRMVVAKSYSGDMPPKANALGIAPLTDEEVAEVMSFANAAK